MRRAAEGYYTAVARQVTVVCFGDCATDGNKKDLERGIVNCGISGSR
jgi:hypothetical protein